MYLPKGLSGMVATLRSSLMSLDKLRVNNLTNLGTVHRDKNNNRVTRQNNCIKWLLTGQYALTFCFFKCLFNFRNLKMYKYTNIALAGVAQ